MKQFNFYTSLGYRPKKLFVVLFIFCISGSIELHAAPAAETPYVIEQPDGNRIQVKDKGNEWKNWVETIEGYVVAINQNGYWYYVEHYSDGNPVLSNIRADAVPPAHIKKHNIKEINKLRVAANEGVESNNSSAPIGSFTGSVLFILTEFSDRKGTTNEANWAPVLANDIADYFEKASHGNVSLIPANETFGGINNGIVGWVDVGYKHPNTGKEDIGLSNWKLTKDAINAANPYVNFAQYDTNNDGFVDSNELAIVIIAAGYERSIGGNNFEPSVWGHQSSISTGAPIVDGVVVGNYHSGAGGYAQFGELHRTNSSNEHRATMGIMVHELGHLIFGLPDLYDIDGSSSGIGAFGVMGGGSWGKSSTDLYSGETPVLPSAWTKYHLGWADGNEGSETEFITASGDPSSNQANTVFRASTGNSDEYFLIENRQPAGYDLGLQRWFGNNFGGLAIWHINDNQTHNKNDNNRRVDLEEADNTEMGNTSGQTTDLFYKGNLVRFDNSSTPNSTLHNGANSGVSIHSISESDTVMSATFGSEESVLENGTTVTDLAGNEDSEIFFQVKIPTGANNLKILMKHGSGDTDLYVKFGSIPSRSNYDCRPFHAARDETCSFAVPNKGTYYIMIRGFEDYSGMSLSATWSNTLAIPEDATLLSPEEIITELTPTYSWNAVANSTWYYLWVDDATGNVIKQWYTAEAAGCASGTGTCSVTPATKLAYGKGNWWIQTWSNSGYGPWSTAMSFTVSSGLTPSLATLVSPLDSISDKTPTYTWNAVEDSTWYYLWVDDATGNVIKQWYTAADAGCASGTGTCSVTPTKVLAYGKGNWWIQTWNNVGYGSWSTAMSYTVTSDSLPSLATLASPTSSLTDSTPTYTWNAVANSTWYYLWVDDVTGNVIKQWYTAADAGCASGSGTCSVTPTAALTAGSVNWWIQTWNNVGYGSWSSAVRFTLN